MKNRKVIWILFIVLILIGTIAFLKFTNNKEVANTMKDIKVLEGNEEIAQKAEAQRIAPNKSSINATEKVSDSVKVYDMKKVMAKYPPPAIQVKTQEYTDDEKALIEYHKNKLGHDVDVDQKTTLRVNINDKGNEKP